MGHAHTVQYISKTEEERNLEHTADRSADLFYRTRHPESMLVGSRVTGCAAAYALFDPQRLTWEARRVSYDYRIVQTGSSTPDCLSDTLRVWQKAGKTGTKRVVFRLMDKEK